MKEFFRKCIKRKNFFISMMIVMVICILALVNYEDISVFINGTRKLPIYSVETPDNKIAISFDASWGSDNTDKILDILDEYEVKATFFLVGGWVDEYPDKVKEIHKRGHEIGNHSNKHPDMTTISREQMIKEIATCDAKIMSITGKTPNLFRCPEGAYNNTVVEVVEQTNHYCIQWDVDSIDWKEQGAEKEYNRVINKTKNGSIILFHNNAKYTPENLPGVLKTLKDKGFEFVKLSDLIYSSNYTIDHTGRQFQNKD